MTTNRYWLLVLVLLAACGPSEKQRAQFAEERRIHCLSSICDGDIVPKYDTLAESVIKVDGQWLIGPRKYVGAGRAGFEWWNHRPLDPGLPRPPEAQARATTGKGYDISIEIFFRAHDGVMHGPPRYEALRQAEAEGRVISKRSPRPGLEVWEVKDLIAPEPALWYAATAHKGSDGLPPVVYCRMQNPTLNRCTTAFVWRPGIAVDVRFRSAHGPDWPEIYEEISRVLQLLRKG